MSPRETETRRTGSRGLRREGFLTKVMDAWKKGPHDRAESFAIDDTGSRSVLDDDHRRSRKRNCAAGADNSGAQRARFSSLPRSREPDQLEENRPSHRSWPPVEVSVCEGTVERGEIQEPPFGCS